MSLELYLQLSPEVLRLMSDRCPLNDFKIPGAEHFSCQICLRLEHTNTTPKGLGQAGKIKIRFVFLLYDKNELKTLDS